jgi:hypothetical protein
MLDEVTSRCICTVQIHKRIQTLQKHNSIFLKLINENYSWEFRIHVSHFGGLGFDFRLLGQLSWLCSVTPDRYWNRGLEINNDCFIFTYFKMYCRVWGVAWLTIMGSGFDNWVYWHFYTIKIYYDSSKSMTVYDSLRSLLDHKRLLFYCDQWRKTNHCSHIELPYE